MSAPAAPLAVAGHSRRPVATHATGPALVLAAALLWGTVGPAQVLANAGIDPAGLGGWRLLLGGALLLLPVVRRGTLAVALSLARRPSVLLAAAATGIFQVAFLYAVETTGAALATAAALGTAPAATGLCAWLHGRNAPGPRWVGATSSAVAGCVLLADPSGGSAVLAGLTAAVAAGGCYGAYTVAAKHLADDGADLVTAAGVTLLLAAVPLLPWTLAAARPASTGRGSLLVLWLGVVTCASAYWLFMRGLRTTPAATAGTLSLAEPAAAVALAVVVLHERLTPAQSLGVVLLTAGLALCAASEGTRRRSSPAGRTRSRPTI